MFSSALAGRCAARPELAASVLPLRVEVPAVPSKDGAGPVRRLFEPPGWAVTAEPVPLDERFPEWGRSPYVRLVLDGELRLADALRHLYVLLPVLGGAKHYRVSPDAVDKLLRAGGGWLPDHPERDLITHRYPTRRRSPTREATERLELARPAAAGDAEAGELDNAVDGEADAQERPVPLAVRRRETVLAALRDAGTGRVLDLGCGEGLLVRELLEDPRFTEVVGVDVSVRALALAARRLHPDRVGERRAARVRLLQGSPLYTDERLRTNG